MKLNLTGIVPAVFTPMHKNGDVNFGMIEKYSDFLVSADIKNVFLLGTAGEGCSLTNDERKKVSEKWMDVARGKIQNIIVHVGASNLADTKILAQHAESIGATAIAALASFYFRPENPRQLALYIAEIAKSAPKTPLLFYHAPGMTKVPMNMKGLLDELDQMGLDNFAGIKFTGHDMCDFGQCVDHYGDKYTMCYGYDEQVMAGLMLGAPAMVGSTYSIALNLYKRLFDACKKGNIELAREEQYKSQRFISCLFNEGIDVGVQKALMKPLTGLDMGPPRLPMPVPSEEKMTRIIEKFKAMGFFEWAK